MNSIEENGGGGGVMRKMLKGLQEGPHTHTCLGAALFDYWSDGHGVSAHDGLIMPCAAEDD